MAEDTASDEMSLLVDVSQEDSVLAELHLPEGSPYKQSKDCLMMHHEFDEDVAAQVIISASPLNANKCPAKHICVVYLSNLMTGPSVPDSQNRHFRGLAASLLVNMLEWIVKERPNWLLEGSMAGETIVGIEAKNQRNTVCRGSSILRNLRSEKAQEERYLADVRDQRALEVYYKRLGFVEDERFVHESNTGTKGFSAKLGELVKSLRSEVPRGAIKR